MISSATEITQEWLEDVLNALEIEAVTIIGLSQGAWTALKFAVSILPFLAISSFQSDC